MTADRTSRFASGRGRRWAASAFAGVLTKAAAPLVGFFLTPYLLAQLGQEGFGLYALSIAMVSWLSVLDLGLTPGLRIVLARRSAKLDPAETERAVSSAAAGQLVLATATLIGGAALALTAPLLSDDPRAGSEEATALILLLASGSAISVAGQFFSASLEAHQLGYVERGARLARMLTRAATTVVLLEYGWGLSALGWAHCAAAASGAAASFLGVRRNLPEARVRLSAVRVGTVVDTARIGLWLSVGAAAGVVIAGADRAMAARLFSLESVAVLALSSALFLAVEGAASQALDAGRPLLAQALGAGNREEAARLYRPMSNAAAAVAILCAAAAFAANPAFVGAWAGPENYGGLGLDAALAAATILQIWTLPHRAAAAAALDVRRATAARLAEAAANLPLSIVLGLWLGLPGILAGTAAAAAATSAWSLPRTACRDLGLPASESLRAAARCLPAATGLAAVATGARFLGLEIGGFTGAAAAAGVTVPAAVLLLWSAALDAPTRRALRRPLAFAS